MIECSGPARDWLVSVVVAAAVALGGLMSLGASVVLATSGGAARLSTAEWLAAVPAALLVLLITAFAALTVLGGVIALRRHGLETRGLPYPPRQRREWRPGFAVRAVHGAMLSGIQRPRALFPYDVVEVRSLGEIQETLDAHGTLEGLPFMPEMAAHCGERHLVLRRVEKINDYVTQTGLRRMRNTVLLERLRCDGQHHGGCQACCHLLWKEAWLKRTAGNGASLGEPERPRLPGPSAPAFHKGDLQRLVTVADSSGEVRYVCQMTEVARASMRMSWNDPRHYLRDLFLGNVRLGRFVVGVSIDMFRRVHRRFGRGVGFPHLATTGLRTSPHQVLDLRPGDVVRVKAKHEIEPTLTTSYMNRGLFFDVEMLRYCGGEYRVSARVERLIEEKSGRLIALGSPGIMLDGVTAGGEYRVFCPQNEAILWREIWLERASSAPRHGTLPRRQ